MIFSLCCSAVCQPCEEEEVGDTLHLRDMLHVCKPEGVATPELAADCS